MKEIMSIPVSYTDDEGNEVEEQMPARYEVCPTCQGRGSQALHGMAITGDEWSQWHEDERESYLNGDYDTICPECNGKRVVLVPDEDRATPAQLKAWNDHVEFEEECANERRNEMRMLGEF